MRRNSILKRTADSNCFKTAVSIGSGICVLILCLLGFAFLMTFFDANDAIKTAMSTIALCAGAFWAGFCCAKNKRKNGILNGLFCGVCVYFAVFLFGTLVLKITCGTGVFGKFMLACVLSACGGILGANSKRVFRAAKTKKNRFNT